MELTLTNGGIMNIKVNHYVELDKDDDILDEDRCFLRTEAGTWFETNGHLGDTYDRVDDETLALRLEAKFWETMYRYEIKF
jgi:hypothetical protein